MAITLTNPRLQKLIDDRIQSGQYPSAESVVVAALSCLEQQEHAADFAPGELNSMIAVGRSQLDKDESLDSEEVFREIDQVRDQMMQRPS